MRIMATGLAMVLAMASSCTAEPTANAQTPSTTCPDSVSEAVSHELKLLAERDSNYIFNPVIFPLMPKTLQNDERKLRDRMGTVSSVEEVPGGYLGVGCMSHACGAEEAAWFLSTDGNKSAAVIMEISKPTPLGRRAGMTEHLVFNLYGASVSSLPHSLASWANERGMTEANSVRHTLGNGPEF